MTQRERMSSLDTAWLRMDRPENHMMIVVVMTFAEPITLRRLTPLLAARFVRFRRFRQRVVRDGDNAYWEADPNFDLSFHVKRIALPAPGGKDDLQELVSDLASTALDPERPLWQFHLVEDYQGGSALIVRIHHCYADGVALVHVLLSLTAESADAELPLQWEEPRSQSPGWQSSFGALTPLLAPWLGVGSSLINIYADSILHPTHALGYANKSVDITAELARLAFMPVDSATRFKGIPTGVKRAAWSPRLPLDQVKAVAGVLQCSVNDVLMSCVCGALRDYLTTQGDDPDGLELRVLVPVNLRPENKTDSLGNYFGMVALLLPLGMENPVKRAYEIQQRMLALKHSSQAPVVLGLLTAAGMVPKALQQQVLDLLASRATAVLTNVPGPQQALYLAGARLSEIVFWVPQSGNIGMGISIMSYDGGVQFGVTIDRKLVRDPENITNRFAAQFEQLLLVALMGDWGVQPTPETAEQLIRD